MPEDAKSSIEKVIASVMGSSEGFDEHTTLLDAGLDSLMETEVVYMLAKSFNIHIDPSEIGSVRFFSFF